MGSFKTNDCNKIRSVIKLLGFVDWFGSQFQAKSGEKVNVNRRQHDRSVYLTAS